MFLKVSETLLLISLIFSFIIHKNCCRHLKYCLPLSLYQTNIYTGPEVDLKCMCVRNVFFIFLFLRDIDRYNALCLQFPLSYTALFKKLFGK